MRSRIRLDAHGNAVKHIAAFPSNASSTRSVTLLFNSFSLKEFPLSKENDYRCPQTLVHTYTSLRFFHLVDATVEEPEAPT